MKRSFFIKQLQSLKSQVESLLEAETDTSTFDIDLPEQAGEIEALAKKLSVKTEHFNNQQDALLLARSAAGDSLSLAEHVKVLWLKLKNFVMKYYTKAKDYLADTAAGKWLIKKYEAVKNAIDDKYEIVKSQAMEDWNSSSAMQQFLFLVGVIMLFVAVIYFTMKNPKASLTNLIDSVKGSIVKSTEAIKDAVSNISVSAAGLMSAIKAVFAGIMAPFKILFAGLKSIANKEFAMIMGISMVCFGASAGILYYRATKEDPKTVAKA